DAALEVDGGEFLRQVRIFRSAGAVEILAVAGLRHEAVHHAMKWHVVVIAFAGQLLQTLGVLRRDIGAELDDDASLGGVDDDGVLLVETGRKRLGDGGGPAQQADENGEKSDYGNL